ncbi:MAG: hypothetical protein JRI86_11600 [Deltaproteobacteria bacterium]|nr:hypothetical protein [Deltaproteobacteria bacterium]
MNDKIWDWKKIVTCVLWIVLLILVVWAVSKFITTNRGMVIHPLDNETSRLASTLFFQKMTALAQLAVALLGVSWVYVILKPAERGEKIKLQANTISCFIMTNLSLSFSLVAYTYGYDFLVDRIFYHATFDLEAPIVGLVKNSQQYLVIKGCVDLVATIFFRRD